VTERGRRATPARTKGKRDERDEKTQGKRMSDASNLQPAPEVEHDPFAGGEIQRVVPTTEAQREVWLADRLGLEASLAYNESASITFDGALDTAALQSALDLLVDRHEALRSTIGDEGTELWIAAPKPLTMELLDVADLPSDAQARQLDAARVEAVETRFDLERGPLIRAVLMRTSPAHHELMLTAHHVACDGWSLGVLATELVSILRAFADGQPSLLDPAPSYGDYALAQREPEAARRQADDERYWIGLYDQDIPTLDLPVDRARSAAHRSFASRREDLLIDPVLTNAIKRFGAQQGTSLFATLFAVYASLLGRLSGAEEVVVGVPTADQPVAGLPGLVGHCVNLLPIRVKVDAEQPMAAHLAATRTNVLDAYEHQSVTFGSLLKKLRVERDPTRLSLVSVMFNLDASLDAAALSDDRLRVQVAANPRRYENFEMFLNVAQGVDGLRLECQYNTGLFDASTVRRWLELYREALQRCVATPDIVVADALKPTAAERALLDRFNATDFEYERTARVDTLITRRALATPAAIAVVSDGRKLSYGDLEARANGLALELARRGIGQGDLVGISCGRNEHMLVALLGVMKSGAGYVPLDPELPRQRLEFMAQDAALQVVLSDASITGEWPFAAAQRLAVDAIAPSTAAWTQKGDVDDVCYAIFTSGSTGTPKGVRIPHRTVVNLMASLRQAPAMTAQSRVLAVTTLSFDIAVSELIAPLTFGACIILADKSQAMDGQRLRALIEQEKVDLIDGTPSTYRMLVASGWAGNRDLKAICIGEPLPPELAQQLIPIIGELWNAYGPTETTVWSTMQLVTHVDGPVPIGRPIENTQIHIVDKNLRLLPLGAIGEIYIAGEGVTLGYLNRPELTEQRFAKPPADASPVSHPSRWYQTGDLGRWRADGILECLGRIDHQVKVRGYRIELGEIESALLRHPAVARAAVVTREDNPGDVRIVAYLVPRSSAPDDRELRRHLGESLPTYMIPQHFVTLDKLPELHNGKLNRHALPKPGAGAPAAAAAPARVAPRNDVERQVLAAMESVLSLPGMSVTDNFFALGGHSLLAMRLTTRLANEFQVELPLRTLFESSTAEAIAAAIGKARQVDAPARGAIRHDAVQSVAPLTLAQERMRFMEELTPGRVTFNTPSAHRLTGPMDVALFERALREIVRRQPVLRTRVALAADGQGFVQQIEDEIDFKLPFEDLTTLEQCEGQLMERMQAIVDQPIDIGQAPLFRAALYRLGPQDHVLLFMTHHIIWDGWSFDVFYEEMAAIYGALVAGKPVELPAPTVTFADFARSLAEWQQGPEAARQLQYWKDRLAKSPVPKAPPTDKPRLPGSIGVGATERVQIARDMTERLRDAARSHDVTLSMLTMSAYAVMLAAAHDSPSIVLGMPVRGRLAPELEGVMGYFINLLPMPFEIDPSQSIGQLVGRLKGEMVEAMDNQEIPFVRLVSDSSMSARARNGGLYQALFSFQDARERRREWGGLKHEGIPIFQKGASEDLGVWLMEVPNGLEGGITYNADLYHHETAVALRNRYFAVLRRIAAEPAVSLSALMAEATAAATAPHVPSSGAAASDGPPPAAASGLASEHERKLAAIWANVLDIDVASIAARDNFFDLGGHSLLAMRAVEDAGRAFGFRIDARRYFYETLGQLANPETAKQAASVIALAAAPAAQAEAPRGLLSRLFGRGKK